MSFDEGAERRTTRRPPPRRPPAPGRHPASDHQTVLIRRGVAVGVGVLVLILLILGIGGCLESRREAALRDYNRDVTGVITASDEQVAGPFFETLIADGSPLERQSALNQLRVQAEEQARRARGFDVPDAMRPAQQALVTVLNLRSGAVAKVAEKLPAAVRGEESAETVDQIAGQMQAFLASDVLYDQRVVPFIMEALADEEVGGQQIADTSFLPNLAWLDPNVVAERIGASGEGAGDGREPAPGTHGHGLTSVQVGDVTLQPGEAVNRIPAASNLAFEVTFQNQGENDEVDVNVRVAISGAGEPAVIQRRVDQTTAGQEATVALPLEEAPPIGEAVTIEVRVEPVPGEETTDNNVQEYTAIFQR